MQWEGLLRSEVEARYGPLLRTWRSRPLEAWAPGGESLPEVQARVRPGLATVLANLAAAGSPGSLDRSPVAGYRDATGRPPVVHRRRARRRVQGHPADAVRPAARPVLDVVDGPLRGQRRGVPRRPAGPPRAQPDRAPRRATRRGGPGRARGTEPTAARSSAVSGGGGPCGGTPVAAGSLATGAARS